MYSPLLPSSMFFMHLSGPCRAISSCMHLLPHPPRVWALNSPSWAFVHKTTYAPMIYTALCIMFWVLAYSLLGQVGGGLGPGNLEFFRPQMELACRLDAILQGPKKLSISRAPPPPTCPCNGYARTQNIMHRAVKIIGAYYFFTSH
jgi:hypothetical protein